VIERVIQLGNLYEWKQMISYYPLPKIIETIEWSAQLDKRDKDFAQVFLTSTFLNAI